MLTRFCFFIKTLTLILKRTPEPPNFVAQTSSWKNKKTYLSLKEYEPFCFFATGDSSVPCMGSDTVRWAISVKIQVISFVGFYELQTNRVGRDCNNLRFSVFKKFNPKNERKLEGVGDLQIFMKNEPQKKNRTSSILKPFLLRKKEVGWNNKCSFNFVGYVWPLKAYNLQLL